MLTLYNTLTNRKEKFQPLHKGKVNFYSCGPTVYNYAHIGNLRTYIFADTLKRVLEFNGFEVKHIMNITDVGHLTEDDLNQGDSGDDKMLQAMKKEKKTPASIAEFYTKAFQKDVKALNIEKANFYPKATAHIPQMIKVIETLIAKGYAYEKNGNVFYDVDKFPDYGKLSNKKLEELQHGARLDKHPDKKHSYDFALWLKAPKEHILKWDSPWGKGYPGWHIECTAMSMEYLGETLDIHTGGEDNIFPHHENEIAQSEAYSEKTFSRYWAHPRHLLVDGQKMSKSKGNFYTLQDILNKGYSPMVFRLLILSSHYRSNLNFTWQAMNQARKNLQKIEKFISKIQNLANTINDKPADKFNDKSSNNDLDLQIGNVNPKNCLDKFILAVDDDLNTPLALSILYRIISEINKLEKISPTETQIILKLWEKINKVLGLKLFASNSKITTTIPAEIKNLSKAREKARNNKDFVLADKLRGDIIEQGYLLEDTPQGVVLKKK
jgi:cysteinyl-tRNA synthetase